MGPGLTQSECHDQMNHLYGAWLAGTPPQSTPVSPCLTHVGLMLCLVAQACLTLCDPMDYSLPGSSVHGDPPGKNTGVGCHVLLQGIFSTQESNLGLLHCRRILYQHLGLKNSPFYRQRGGIRGEHMESFCVAEADLISETKDSKFAAI